MNGLLARQALEAISAGDHHTLRGLVADDVIWHFPGRSPLAGDHPGAEASLGFLVRIYDLTDGTYRIEVHDVVANDRYAVALIRTNATLAGAPFSDEGVTIMRIVDGRIADVRCYSSNQEDWDSLIDEVLATRG